MTSAHSSSSSTTTSSSWNIEDLKKDLAPRSDKIKGWVLSRETVRRRERYFLAESPTALAIDQDRLTTARTVFIQLFVTLPQKPGFQGEISVQLYPALPLAPQIERAIRAAQQTEHQQWELPVAPQTSEIPSYQGADPQIAEDLEGALDRASAEIEKAALKKRLTRFNSAELFLTHHTLEVSVSHGFSYASERTTAYIEAAFSAPRTETHDSNEYLGTHWSVSLEGLNISRFFDDVAARAEISNRGQTPLPGEYAVVVDAEVLSTLFNAQLRQLSGATVYQKLPSLNVGDEFITGCEGDLIDIRLDPSLKLGADTVALADAGIVQRPLDLVQNNRVVSSFCSKRYADYLGNTPTTTRGSWVITAHSVASSLLNHADLLTQAPKVIEVLQFSSIFPDGNKGTFSSEIRLAKLYDNEKGTVTFIKGGSLSGSLKENFRRVRFSRETLQRALFESDHAGVGYLGPAYALLNNVTLVS